MMIDLFDWIAERGFFLQRKIHQQTKFAIQCGMCVTNSNKVRFARYIFSSDWINQICHYNEIQYFCAEPSSFQLLIPDFVLWAKPIRTKPRQVFLAFCVYRCKHFINGNVCWIVFLSLLHIVFWLSVVFQINDNLCSAVNCFFAQKNRWRTKTLFRSIRFGWWLFLSIFSSIA